MIASPDSFAAFSGGGWNSHTVSSAMVGGAIEAAKKISQETADLGMPTLFGNLSGLAGNSGGSWFTTMLTYSEQFANDLANAPQDWFSTGYMGQQKELIGIPSRQDAAAALNEVLDSIVAGNVRSLPGYELVKSKVLGSADVADFVTKTIFDVFNKALVDTVLLFTPSEKDPGVENIAGLVSLFYGQRNEGDNTPNWANIVKDVAFGSYDMTTELSQPLATTSRLDWAADKNLIFGASKPNQETISYYDLLSGGSFSQSTTPIDNPVDTSDYYTPITIAMPSQRTPAAQNELIFTAGDLDVSYKKQLLGMTEAQASGTLSNLNVDDLSIIDAATISGSFAGGVSVPQSFAAIIEEAFSGIKSEVNSAIESNALYQKLPELMKKAVIDAVDAPIDAVGELSESIIDFFSAPVANFLADMAVPVNTAGGKAVVAEPDKNGDLQSIASAGNVRLMDGGYTDNTAVANILSQLHASTGEFEITAFVNDTDTAQIPQAWTGHEALTVGTDLPMLFGSAGDDLVQPFTKFPGSPPAAYPAVFDKAAWQSEKPVWQYADEASNTVVAYYRLDVETIDNPLFDVKAGRSGVLNVFSTYSLGSGPGPYFPNAFEIYEGIYDATRSGVIGNGGYIHVLESLGSMRLQWDETADQTAADAQAGSTPVASDGPKIHMVGSEGVSSKMTLSVKELSSTQDIFLDVYKTNDAGAKSFVGTIGGSAQEQGMGHQGLFDLFRLGVGESLEFQTHGSATNQDTKQYAYDYTRDDSAYGVRLVDPQTQEEVMTLELAYVPLESDKDSFLADQTQRDDASDAYIFLSSGLSVDFSLQAPAAKQNTFSMVQIDVDEKTGAISFDGHLQDTLEFDQAVRAAIENNEFFDKIEVEPYSASDQAVTAWTPGQEGYYAPVMLTEDDKLYLAGHDLFADSSQARVVGYGSFAFEDIPVGSGSDRDFNDLVVQMSVYTAA